MENREIRPPLRQKPLNRSPPKFAWVITSGTPTLCKILSRYDYPIKPQICENTHQVTRQFYFGSFFCLQPRPLHRFSRSIGLRQMMSFRSRMCFLGVSKTKLLYFDPICPQKRNFLPNYRRDLEISRQKGLNEGMLIRKLLLIVIVAP